MQDNKTCTIVKQTKIEKKCVTSIVLQEVTPFTWKGPNADNSETRLLPLLFVTFKDKFLCQSISEQIIWDEINDLFVIFICAYLTTKIGGENN